MGRIKSGEVNEQKIDMTPMIDCIFQLIIFFMCSIKFKSLEGKLLSYLPKDVGLMNTQVANPNLDEVRIKLVYDESRPYNTRIELKSTGAQPVQIDTWEELSSEVGRRFEEIRSNNMDVPFIIDPQPKIPLQAVVNALDACRSAHIEDVRFAAKSPVSEPLKRK